MEKTASLATLKRDRRQEKFLAAVSKHLTIGEACRRSGVSQRTVFSWRQADPEFERKIWEAQEPLYDTLETTGMQRALNLDGKFDERTAFLYWVAIMKARRHVYRDSHKAVDVTGEIKFTHQMTRSAAITAALGDGSEVVDGEFVALND